MPPSAPTNNPQARETTHLLNMICDRAHWYSQIDDATKKIDKIKAQKEKLSKAPSEFVSEHLFLQTRHREAEALKKKGERQVSTRDSQVLQEFLMLLEKYQKQSTTAASEDRIRKLEASLDKKIEDKAKEHALKLKEEYQSKESELVRRLDEETSRNKRLEEKLDQLAAQVNNSSNERSKLTKEFSQFKEGVDIGKLNQMQEKIEGQDRQIASLQSLRETAEAQQQQIAISASNETQAGIQATQAADIDELRARVTAQEQQIADLRSRREPAETSQQLTAGLEPLRTQVDYHEEQITSLKPLRETVEVYRTMVKDVLGDMRLISDKISKHEASVEDLNFKIVSKPQPSSSGNGLSTSTTDNVLQGQALEMVEARLKQNDTQARTRFGFLSKQIGDMIDQEREARQTLEQWVKDSLSKQTIPIEDINKSLEATKVELATVAQLANKLKFDVGVLQERLADSQKRLDTKTEGDNKIFEDVGMRIHHLNLWRDNFSTKDLARDMVVHIAHAIPQGVHDQVQHLSERINNLEVQVYNSALEASKKRKLPNGTAVPATSPTDSHP